MHFRRNAGRRIEAKILCWEISTTYHIGYSLEKRKELCYCQTDLRPSAGRIVAATLPGPLHEILMRMEALEASAVIELSVSRSIGLSDRQLVVAPDEGVTLVQPPNDLRTFDSLLQIVAALRAPDGCPWDKEQTHRSLTPFAIEEAHELAEAVENGDEREMVSELGDLLLQVVLHAEIGRQESRFDVYDVIGAIGEKMVRRHPHVFADATASTSAEVLDNWSKIKAAEKAAQKVEKNSNGDQAEPQRFDVSPAMPALSRSQKIGDKTKRLRFDWNNATEVLQKVDEEIGELKAELVRPATDKAALEHEIGDVLFSVAQLARHLGLEAEQCLRTANSRFERRYFTMRQRLKDQGQDYDRLTTAQLEQAWQETKAAMAR